MKNLTIKITFIICVIILLITLDQNNLMSSSSAAPFCYMGDPVAAPVCATSGCHGGGQINAFTGNISITSNAANNIYKIYSTYTITYTVTESGKVRFGFESVVLNSSNNAIGTFTVINSANTYSAISSGRRFVGHVNAGSNKVWTVKWKAPSTYGGPVTFYAAGNAANGNGNADAGDHIYKSTLILYPAVNAGISEQAAGQIKLSLYPNPASNEVNVETTDASTSIDLYDINMKHVLSFIPENPSNGIFKTKINISSLQTGVYFVHVQTKNEEAVTKLFVSNNR